MPTGHGKELHSHYHIFSSSSSSIIIIIIIILPCLPVEGNDERVTQFNDYFIVKVKTRASSP